MGKVFAVDGTTLAWDPAARVFDYRAGPPGPSREDKERLIAWMQGCAGEALPYGLLVERYADLRGERISGFSLAEIMRMRSRLVIACIGVTRSESVMIPIVAAMTGVRMEAFADREAARRWLAGKLSPCTSSTATP